MQDAVIRALEALNGTVLWGPPMLVLLVGTGIFLTIALGGLQLRRLGESLWLALVVRRERNAEGDISHFQVLMTALSATVGTGNIVGVATAIQLGGPGALFWMWVTGIFGMATKYAEALLGVKYRTTDAAGTMSGGSMYFLRDGLRWPAAGRILGGAFALFSAIAAFGIGNLVQANSVADVVQTSFSISPVVSGAVMAALTAAVILGGIRSIGRASSVLAPAMIFLYGGSAIVILLLNASLIPGAFALVFSSAFSGTSAIGGFAGAGVAQAIRMGVARGAFSNEAGLGSGSVTAAAAETLAPVRQAMVSMTQTFIDTIVICTLTGLVILVTNAWASGEAGATITSRAFATGLPGEAGHVIVAVSLSLFAYSTLIGWSYIGEKGAEYLLGDRVVTPYRVLFVAAVIPGALFRLGLVWAFADTATALMAIPNQIGVVALSGVVIRETRSYFATPWEESSFATQSQS
jgi:AGCS family alanine or glycine:cation symporter